MLPNCDSSTFLVIAVALSCCLIQFVDCHWEGEKRYWPWKGHEFPDPWKDPRKCGRTLPAFVCDPDRMLTTEQSSGIDKTLWVYGRNSICLCDSCSFANRGISIGVAIVKDAHVKEIYGDIGYNETWKQFADTVRRNWSLGACDNDVVIVISPYGGALSFGEVSAKIMEHSSITKLTSSNFPKSRDDQVKFINKIIEEIHSYDLMNVGQLPDLRSKSTPRPPEPTGDPHKITGMSVPPPLIEEDSSLVIAGSSPISTPSVPSSPKSIINTQSANTYIAAAEDDEFKVPEDKKISSSLAFMIVGSLTVILVSLIALFLIIWYYRTKTGNIEPNTVYTKPSTEEKAPSDIKAVKYEPCKTDEPGLAV